MHACTMVVFYMYMYVYKLNQRGITVTGSRGVFPDNMVL